MLQLRSSAKSPRWLICVRVYLETLIAGATEPMYNDTEYIFCNSTSETLDYSYVLIFGLFHLCCTLNWQMTWTCWTYCTRKIARNVTQRTMLKRLAAIIALANVRSGVIIVGSFRSRGLGSDDCDHLAATNSLSAGERNKKHSIGQLLASIITMGCNQSIPVVETKPPNQKKETHPQTFSGKWNQKGFLWGAEYRGCFFSFPNKPTFSSDSISTVQPTRMDYNSEDCSSRLTRGNSSDSIPSTQLATSSSLSCSTKQDGGILRDEPSRVQVLDIDAAVEDLNKRAAVGAGSSGVGDAEDPFADDCSAVFDVEEDAFLDDNLSIGSAAAQEALRGLTLEAKLSIVELVRSNSINQIVAWQSAAISTWYMKVFCNADNSFEKLEPYPTIHHLSYCILSMIKQTWCNFLPTSVLSILPWLVVVCPFNTLLRCLLRLAYSNGPVVKRKN